MKLRIYQGVLIERSFTGLRWLAFIPGVAILRADTLEGIRRLIREAR